jgi:hypothetical protein
MIQLYSYDYIAIQAFTLAQAHWTRETGKISLRAGTTLGSWATRSDTSVVGRIE